MIASSVRREELVSRSSTTSIWLRRLAFSSGVAG